MTRRQKEKKKKQQKYIKSFFWLVYLKLIGIKYIEENVQHSMQ